MRFGVKRDEYTSGGTYENLYCKAACNLNFACFILTLYYTKRGDSRVGKWGEW